MLLFPGKIGGNHPPRPPGPRNGLLGAFNALRTDSLRFLTGVAREYGDIAYFRALHQHIYLINSPALVQEVLVNKSAHFIKGRVMQRARVVLGNGLLTNEGASHLRQRRLVQPAFHQGRLAWYANAMTDLAVSARERWAAGQTIELTREMQRLTLSIVARTLFSAGADGTAPRVGKPMGTLLKMMPLLRYPLVEYLRYLPLAVSRRFTRANTTLDRRIYRLIRERRLSGNDTGDLLSMLLMARDHEGDGAGMTDHQIRDEAVSLFLAGHETTASGLTWTLWLLSRHPEVEAQLHQVIDRELQGRVPTFDDLPRLAYVQNIFAEALRLYPPAWAIGRQVTEQVEIGGYLLPRGSVALLCPYVMQRSPKYWHDPELFKPERWAQEDRARPKFAYFPFGGGSRLCVGERFAWMEGVLLLTVLAQRWRFRIQATHHPLDPAPILLRPKGRVRAILQARDLA